MTAMSKRETIVEASILMTVYMGSMVQLDFQFFDSSVEKEDNYQNFNIHDCVHRIIT